MSELRIVSRTRAEPFTNAETVTLGRVLAESSGTKHISFPDITATATTVVHEYSGDLSAVARGRVHEILGEVDETLAD